MKYLIGDRTYIHDSSWGKLPTGYEFTQVAGVAVDGNDNVYVFNRSQHKLMVFSRKGELVKVWERPFAQPHGAHVDKNGKEPFFRDMGKP